MKLFYPFKQRFLEVQNVLKFVEEADYLAFVWPVSTNLQKQLGNRQSFVYTSNRSK